MADIPANKCIHCAGTGEIEVEFHLLCLGTGEVGGEALRQFLKTFQDDTAEALADVMDKCNDIKEKVDEIKDVVDALS